jgi:hypothetical protein
MQAEQPGFNSQKELEIFLFLLHTDHFCGPPSLLSSEYQWFFVGVKWTRHEADHLPPSSAKVKKEWSYTSTATHVFMA